MSSKGLAAVAVCVAACLVGVGVVILMNGSDNEDNSIKGPNNINKTDTVGSYQVTVWGAESTTTVGTPPNQLTVVSGSYFNTLYISVKNVGTGDITVNPSVFKLAGDSAHISVSPPATQLFTNGLTSTKTVSAGDTINFVLVFATNDKYNELLYVLTGYANVSLN